jgi:TRAP-type C4-dicarboxylate transport system permease small subunit
MPGIGNLRLRASPKNGFGNMAGKIERLEKFAHSSSHWVNWMAGIGLVAMFGLIVADIIGIKFFKHPVPGAIEMVAFLGVVVTGFAIAFTQVRRGHIQVEFFVMRLPPHARAGVTAFVSLLGMVLFGLLAWQSFEFGQSLQASGEVSMTQGIPFYPFVYAISFCCLPICLLLLVDFVKSITQAVKK